MVTTRQRGAGAEMGRVTATLSLSNYRDVILANADALPGADVRRVEIDGIVDSGATRLVIPSSVAEQLGLDPTGEARVRYADQRSTKREIVKDVYLELLGREGVFTAIVEPNRTTALIGAIVLEDLDLLVDCVAQRVYPRDPNWIISEIE